MLDSEDRVSASIHAIAIHPNPTWMARVTTIPFHLPFPAHTAAPVLRALHLTNDGISTSQLLGARSPDEYAWTSHLTTASGKSGSRLTTRWSPGHLRRTAGAVRTPGSR
jgi:hypothetical protein